MPTHARSVMPMMLARVFGAVLAFIVGTLFRVRRTHVTRSVRAAGIEADSQVADAMYRSLGTGVGELMGFALGARARVDLSQIDGETIQSALAGGRGVVVVTAHTGNWDLVACAAAQHVPLTVVTKHLSIRFLDWIWQRVRSRAGVRLIEQGRAARVASKALARGEAVAFLIDQAPERERGTIVVPFLGRPARVDLAPALVAMRSRAPIAIVFAKRVDDGGHCAEVRGLIPAPARPSRAWAEAAMRRVTGELEAFVREQPEQWLWMHRRWKGLPDAAALPALAPRPESV